jgi:hypothetical protein
MNCVRAALQRCPVRPPSAPASRVEARGRFLNTGNAFNMQLPPAEPGIAFDPVTPTSLVACDISTELGCGFPATTLLVLAPYADPGR